MNKSNLEYREAQKIRTELQKVDKAERNYEISMKANRMAINFFIIAFLAVVISFIFEMINVETNTMLVITFITVFSILAFIAISISNNYKMKTLNLLENYYNKKEI